MMEFARLTSPIAMKLIPSFKEIYRDHRFSVMPINNPPVLMELWGSREARLNSLEQAIQAEKNKRI